GESLLDGALPVSDSPRELHVGVWIVLRRGRPLYPGVSLEGVYSLAGGEGLSQSLSVGLYLVSLDPNVVTSSPQGLLVPEILLGDLAERQGRLVDYQVNVDVGRLVVEQSRVSPHHDDVGD